MEKETVSLSVLLTIAMSLLSLGANLIQQGQYPTGAVCIIIGFALILTGVYLLEKGIITRLKR